MTLTAQDYEDRLDKLFALLSNLYDWINNTHTEIIGEIPFPLLSQVLYTLGEIDCDALKSLDESIGNIMASALEELHMGTCISMPCNVCHAVEGFRYFQSLR